MTATDLPRLVVAAPRSGAGKTTVTVGLMAALAGRGHAVSGHKVGPDFIDPGWHALATGRPPRNLDAFLVGPELIGPLFAHGTAGADLAVIEGVMGLFDGRAADDEASTAHVARLLRAPVVLVVDAAAASRSVAAEVHGFATFDPRVGLAGVILNRVGSEGHEWLLRQALEPLGIPVLGALHRDDELTTPSRHLGLVTADERGPAARETVARLAAAIARSVDLDAVVRVARSAPALDVAPWSPGDVVPPPAGGRRPVVAVAQGPAFTFRYREHRELLVAAGADVADFDPTVDEVLPPRTDAILLGGGFPEEHLDELGANARLRDAVAAHAAAGRPVVAECGGLLYLVRRLEGRAMCGVLDAEARWGERLVLGYRQAVAATSSPIGPVGTPVRAHEFHRTVVEPRASQAPAWRLADGTTEGFAGPRLHASYLHTHWAATPQVAATLVGNARQEVAA